MPEGQAPFPWVRFSLPSGDFRKIRQFEGYYPRNESQESSDVSDLGRGDPHVGWSPGGHRPAEVRSLGEFNLITPDQAVREKSQVRQQRVKG